MTYSQICISSGHGAKVAGACGIIREHEEAVRVVNQLAIELQHCGINVHTFEDTVSTTQNENLNRIVDWHNSKPRDLDISVHFNAFEQREEPVGCEVWYRSQKALAAKLSEAIAEVGFIDRGAKCDQPDHALFFLSNTAMPAVLLEICFVDSEADCDIYAAEFKEICINLAEALSGDEDVTPPPEPEVPEDDYLFEAIGRCSHFGGPDDTGVSASEGLAFHFTLNEANQHLFLPFQPAGTTGLARRLNARAVNYIACRWDYSVTPKEMLAGTQVALVTNPRTGRSTCAFPADWGPHEEKTGRAADLSPALMDDLGLQTDDVVEVIYPWTGD